MSCSYYFEKWKKILIKLDELIGVDINYQDTKTHDKQWCNAVQRLTGVLGEYMFVYNDLVDCCHHNLQVQKAEDMIAIMKALVARILELKEQLRKLVGTEYQFMGNGLTDHKLTTYDIILSDVFPKHKREENINTLVLESINGAKSRKRKTLSVIEFPELLNPKEEINWWEDNNEDDTREDVRKGINVTAVYELVKKEQVTVEMLEVRKNATLIQAHERLRKLTILLIKQKLKREKWEKELNGTLQPPARRDIRERSAKVIQRVFRAYFEIKRIKRDAYKRDEMLTLRQCTKQFQNEEDNDMLIKEYVEKFKKYEVQWNENYDKIKQKFIERKRDSIEDDIRDEIMYWFRTWFDEASYFRDIPKQNEGGSILIVKEEIPSPKEWLEKYKTYLEEKRANKNKTAYELKYEKLEAKKEKLLQKRAEHLKKRMEEKILKKMMKNPKFHPGYFYPQSKKMEHLIKTMEDYKTHWSSLDNLEAPGVKEKFVLDVDTNNAYMDAKLEIRKSVDVAMRDIFNELNKALTEDYKRNGEEMPELIKERKRRRKKKRKHKIEYSKDVADKLEDLAHRGFLKEYPPIKVKHFIGDPNFAGDDLRCKLQATEAFAGETTALWWEKCRELSHGCHRILLVGAVGSGKTTLVHILATMNDAVMYEIDPAWVPEELLSAIYLQELANSIADCARATQPSVIYIRHVHRLYYMKTPLGEDKENLNLIKRYLLRKILKKVHKSDRIIIAASCIEPWLTSSKKMLKQFPSVILMPNSNYTTVTTILNNWILNNHVIPKDLDVQSLAHVLQDYSFGHIQDTLNGFLTADRVIRIATYGLSLHDIYESFLESHEVKVNYDRYIKWYTEKSYWGKKGKQLLEDQKEFQLLVEKLQQNQKKKKKNKLGNALSDVSTKVDSKL